jgi:aryl-alcohol dehydrogenase-like predicted oxidoreductase
MIPFVRFGRSGLQTSRLALGLSRLHRMPSSKSRQDLLSCAADLGFRHFDAARIYGEGLAEAELGRFLKGRRNNFVVATKFGIPSNPIIERVPAMATPVMGVRSIARRLGWREKRQPIDAGMLRASIARSLRALGTDVLDVLLLHEPTVGLIPRPDELIVEMQRAKASGAVRFFGVAGYYQDCKDVCRLLGSAVDVVQTAETEWTPDGLVPDLTFGAMRGGPQSRFEKALDEHSAAGQLSAALRRRPSGAVIVSTRNESHLRTLAEIAAGSGA